MEPAVEDSSDTDKQASRRAQIGIGVLLIMGGTAVVALAVGWIPSAPEKFNAPRWVVGAAGMMFALAGALMLIPEGGKSALGAFLGATMASLFALVGGWVAFGPGERRFSGAVASGGAAMQTDVGEYLGRGAFGVGALILICFAAWAWLRWLRMLRGSEPSDE
jgi:MFS family permease